MLTSPGCEGASEDKASSGKVSLEIRFQDDIAPALPSSAGTLRFASLAAAPNAQAVGPTTHDQVARILVDVTAADSGQPFFLNFDLAKIAADGDHTCAILASGAVRCWGRNDFGQLGRGNTQNLGDNEFVYSADDVDLAPASP